MARYTYRKHYTWTADLAYIVGLMASDGCLINDGRHLNIVSKDQDIIDAFRSVLGVTAKDAIKIGGYGTAAINLSFGDVALYDFLLAVGLTPANSHTISKLNVPDQYYADFLRGHFDGDGTIYGYRDTRWKNRYMFYASFISASRPFLVWLYESNERLFGLTKRTIKPGTRAEVLNYAKADSRKLFQAMYADPCRPKLARKYNKFVAFLESDPYPSKE